ncbi:biosynthetic-type acetolactate synthase large subunit [Clostridium aestuarii]|uniref:Acetolactate synthase n=1 Tax=Clostridium aestuarii TaxID=338193 RepID=A0ABT4D051_9CLOT|nr:biosynthetic-type acetolactate synthase large subunit [Clostridium aestuarii]MCY6484611.1 biosynthetic-type acetolactate synthase large subunit [Clostridium aestuarii]
MKVGEVIIKCLEKENVEVIFGYPGGAVLPIYEALRKSKIKHVLVRQEQAAAHNANGYARAMGGVGVCVSTSGPGATNLITGIATAYMDSIPMVIFTGQVATTVIGKDVFQEADITGATEPFTKHNYLVKDAEQLPRIIKEAFYIASTGRKGPVLIDIPMDIQDQEIKFRYPDKIDIRGYKPTTTGHPGQIKKALKELKNSKRPLILVGGGIISSCAKEELKIFSEKYNIPVVHTLMGIGALPVDSPQYIGMVGFHGKSYASEAIKRSDLLIVIGSRIANRAKANYNFANKKIIHLDIDPAEIGKNIDTTIPLVGDAKIILKQFIEYSPQLKTAEWIDEINLIKNSYKEICYECQYVNPKNVLKIISDIVDNDTIVTADVGQNQIWAAHNYEIKGNRQYFTSGGLGTMGYSVPAGIGAKLASPKQRVISIVGDGGIQMHLGELGTLSENNLNNIIILFNNCKLGMVRELQDGYAGKGKYCGIDFGVNPDFVKIAEAYGIWSKKVTSDIDFKEVFKEALDSNKPCLIECIVDWTFGTM